MCICQLHLLEWKGKTNDCQRKNNSSHLRTMQRLLNGISCRFLPNWLSKDETSLLDNLVTLFFEWLRSRRHRITSKEKTRKSTIHKFKFQTSDFQTSRNRSIHWKCYWQRRHIQRKPWEIHLEGPCLTNRNLEALHKCSHAEQCRHFLNVTQYLSKRKKQCWRVN